MRKFMNSEQSGRSMVEMLGVLAIIGVLSVGGISGYSKAMAKFKLSKAMDQMSMLVANIRTTYASMATYGGLSTAIARSYGLASRDMFGPASGTLVNAFGGSVLVGATQNNGINGTGFAVVYNGLDREACMSLATADWGSAGLVGLVVAHEAEDTEPTAATAITPNYDTSDLPVSLANASDSCSAQTAVNSITWVYY
ncbi:MAG: type 4 pilus major pilin [Alphaproteobacteria bacterium]|nr:type 4 pilus major pilin [Alphaproteobacteria bacterium]